MKFAPLFLIGALAFFGARGEAQTATPSPTPASTPISTPSLTIFDDATDETDADAQAVAALPPAPEIAPDVVASTPTPTPSLRVEKQASPSKVVSKAASATAAPATDRVLDAPQIATLPAQDEWLRADTSLNAAASRLGLSMPLPQARIVVLKSKRRLELWSGQKLVKVYRVALGNNPSGAKQRQHDSRTPEGRFYICTRNSTTSAFHVFLGLSYPGIPDAVRGKKTGLISPREYAMIRNRLASRQKPLWETRLGGWVGIHGGSDQSYAKKQMNKRGRADWTAGCIAVTDREIEEIHRATVLGTPVWVRP